MSNTRKRKKRVEKKKDPSEWLKGRLELLFRYPELSKISPDIYNKCGVWTPLKIIGVGYFASIYSKIISKQPWVKKWYYIDLFAGSGIHKVSETGDTILGTCIHAIDSFKNPPHKVFLVEKDPEKKMALENRLNFLKSNVDKFIGSLFSISSIKLNNHPDNSLKRTKFSTKCNRY